jgi:hypothetical protein
MQSTGAARAALALETTGTMKSNARRGVRMTASPDVNETMQNEVSDTSVNGADRETIPDKTFSLAHKTRLVAVLFPSAAASSRRISSGRNQSYQ